MVVLDDLKDLVLYKKPFFLPIDENDKKNNSSIMLLTPNYQSSILAMQAPYTINRRYFESYYLEKNIYRYINSKGLTETPVPDQYLFNINEADLTTKARNAMDDSDFGLPEKRKYPMPDKKHVLLAIKFFKYVDKEDESELAENIIKKIKEFKMNKLVVGDGNKFYKYWWKEFKESVINDETYDIVNESANQERQSVIAVVNKALSNNGLKGNISKTGEWGSDSFVSGKDDSLCVAGFNKDTYEIAYKAVKAALNSDDYRVTKDNYFTFFVKAKKSINEAVSSKLDFDFKKQGSLKLSSYKKAEITESNINQYKESAKYLSHFRTGVDYKGYVWVNDDHVVAACNVNVNKNEIQAIEISNKYKAHGLSSQILDVCVKNLKGYKLSVSKSNEVAFHLYKKYGFTVYEESESMYFMHIEKYVNEAESLELSYYFSDDIADKFNNTVDMSTVEDEPLNESNQNKIETCTAIIMDNSGRILVEAHNRTNTLNLPGGKVDSAIETNFDAIERELKEELGITVKSLQFMYAFTFGFKYVDDPTNYICTNSQFFIKSYEGTIVNKEEDKHKFIKFMSIEEIMLYKGEISKVLKRFIAQYGRKLSKDPANYLLSLKKKSNIQYTGYQNDLNSVEAYLNMGTLKAAFAKCGVKYPSSAITVVVSGSESDYGYVDENTVTVLSKSVFERMFKDTQYADYINLISMMFVYYTVNPKVSDNVLYPLAMYKSGNADAGIKLDDSKYYQEKVYKYIETKYGNKELINIVKNNSMKKVIEYAKEMTRVMHTESMLYLFMEADEEPSTTVDDIQNIGKNIAKKIKQSTAYKLNKIKRDIQKGNTGSEARKMNSFQKLNTGNVVGDSAESIMELANNQCLSDGKYMYFFEDVDYDTMLRRSLYADRIKTLQQILDIYKQVRSDCPFIRWTFADLQRYGNKNLFFDLSYYNESYFRNLVDITDNTTSIKSLKMYKDFLRRLIDDDRFKSYNKKTIFIPVLDWNHNKSTRMWIYREDLNPISIIYDMMRTNPQDLKRLFKGMDIVFMGSHNYFKINFDRVDMAKDNVAMRYTMLIKRLVALGFTGTPDDDPVDEPARSAKGIALDIVDKIEKSQNISIKSVKSIMDLQPKSLLSPEKIEPIIAVKKVDSSTTETKPDITKTTATIQVTPEDKEKATKVANPSVDPSVNAVPVEKDKENLVAMVAKAAENSSTTDEAIEKLDDEELFKILLMNLKDQEEENIRVSKTRAARITELSNDFKNKEVNGKSVKDLLSENPNDLELPSTDLPINTITDNWKNLTFMNFDKTYDPDADIVKMLNSMTKWSYPIAVRNITVTDNSTSEDYVNLWDIDCEDFKGTRFKLKLDIPKFINDKFLKLRGNEKSLMIQSTPMPVLKTDLDTCQIIGVGGYNKIFVRRYGSGSGKSMPNVDRLIKTLGKYEGTELKITLGNNTKICNKYELPIDYIDLASYYDKIEGVNSILYFNQDDLRKEYEVDDSQGLPIGIRKTTDGKNTIIYYNADVAKTFKMISKYIGYLVMDNVKNPSEIVEIYNNTIAAGKRYMYSRASILSVKIPLVVVCAYVEGLSATLRKANIEFTFKQTLEKQDKLQDEMDYIQFSDGYLMYQLSYESSLLMNGLKECDTQSYSIKDINSKEMYMDFLTDFGGNLKSDGLENSYDCMIDPITEEILKVYKLPSDYVSVLLHANTLLADNKFVKHTDYTTRRLRRKELIAGYFYKALTMSYQSYANQIRHTRKSVKMTMKQSAVIDMILSRDPSTNDLSVNNAINDIEAANTITNKGLVGMNTDRAYSLDKRGYDDSMLNILGMSTGFSGTVGINRQATVDCNIVGTRGFIKPIDGNVDKFSSSKTLTMTEALTPFGSTHDDPFRTLMTFIQTSKHMVRTTYSDPLLVTNGSDEAIPYMTSDIFAFKAKKDGTVKEIIIDEKQPKNSYMILEYKDGTHDYIDLSEEIKKNSDGGYSVPMKLDTDLKVGEKIKAGEIVAYDKSSFSNSLGENDNIAMNIGTLAKVAIMNTDEGFEDSAAATAKFARKLGTDVIVKHDKTIDKNSNVFLMKKIGDQVMEGDTLLSYQASFDDDVANSLLKNLSMSEDEISELGRNPIRSHYTGILQDIKIYRTVEIDELSPSLQKLVKMYEDPIKKRKKVYNQYGIDPATLPATQKLDNTGKTKNVYDGVLIEFYIKYTDEMSIGDKVVFYSANKGILKYIIPDGLEPYTDFRPEEKIDAFVSIGSINGRMVCSTAIYGAMAKLMIELDRSCKDLAGIPYDASKI